MMKVKTLAAVIVAGGPEKYGQEDFQVAQAFLEAGGAEEVEAQYRFVETPFVEGELLDWDLFDFDMD